MADWYPSDKNIIFETIDITQRKIRLTKRQWEHITTTHYELSNYLEEIKQTIEYSIKVTHHKVGNLRKYFNYLKHRNHPDKYLFRLSFHIPHKVSCQNKTISI